MWPGKTHASVAKLANLNAAVELSPLKWLVSLANVDYHFNHIDSTSPQIILILAVVEGKFGWI